MELKLEGVARHGYLLSIEAHPDVGVGRARDGAQPTFGGDSITSVESSTELRPDLLKTLGKLRAGHSWLLSWSLGHP